MLLDKVQKNKLLNPLETNELKKLNLIEGRKPNYFISSGIADVSGKKANYIRNRAFDDDFYKKMIISLIEKYSSATRIEIEELLLDKLSDILTIQQKKNKVTNLLSLLRNDKLIINKGSRTKSKWELL